MLARVALCPDDLTESGKIAIEATVVFKKAHKDVVGAVAAADNVIGRFFVPEFLNSRPWLFPNLWLEQYIGLHQRM